MQTTPPLRRVEADKFFPCQNIAARSRNGAVDAIESHDTGAVVFRYVHARYHQRAFRNNAILGATFGILVPVAGWVYGGVNTYNALRSRKTKRACKAELQRTVPPPLLKDLRKQYNGYSSYLGLLRDYEIDVTEVTRLREHHGMTRAEVEAQQAAAAAAAERAPAEAPPT